MYTKATYTTSGEFAIGFFVGVAYSANVIGELQYDFSSMKSEGVNSDNYYEEITHEDIQLAWITDGIKKLKLNWPLTVSIEKEGNIYLASNVDFNVHAIGESKEDVIQQFQSTFIHFWHYYKEIDNNQLIGFGRRLKALFGSIVKE